jgi:hypothetical protein
MLRKLFRSQEIRLLDILEKEMVDETIFLSTDTRDRLMLDLIDRVYKAVWQASNRMHMVMLKLILFSGI